jgi:iron complex transport system substrate-binding protein
MLVAIFMLLASACNTVSDSNSSTSREITDMLGRRVEIPANIEKIVGVGPGALRLLMYMDLGDKISGVEDVELRPGRPYTFACPELTEKPVIGPYMGGDSELIAVNKPDVVFIAFSTISDADELQKRTGLPVVAINNGNLGNARDTLYRAFKLIGEITEKMQRAEVLQAYIEGQIQLLDSITNQSPLTESPRAYVGGVSYRGAHGISSTQAYFPPFSFVKAINVAGNLKVEESVNPIGIYIDVEQLIQWNPDYLFFDASGLTLIRPDVEEGTPLSIALSAIKQDNVYSLMPHNWYATNYENVLANAWFTGKVMYPQRFSEIDMEQKAREIYRIMLGRDVYDKMNTIYDGWEKL